MSLIKPISAHQEFCRVCGCTQDDACRTAHGPCFWIERGLCSGCVPVEMVEAILEMEAERDA